MRQNTALILSGGGARGAYQAGVLKGLAEILPEKKENPFKIISGVSAGAINSAKLATEIDHFGNAIEKLIYLWAQLGYQQVFKTDFLSVNKLPFSFFGQNRKLDSLLDTSPLNELIKKNCDFSRVERNIQNGKLDSLIITANNYTSGAAVSFIQSSTSYNPWKESRRVAVNSVIDENHIMASSAIPMLFPPIQIGQQYYGDGCVRNHTPCSPSIRLGADRLFVIGVRTQLTAEQGQFKAEHHALNNHPPSVIRIFNSLLNAVLLDSVEQDVYRIQRINQLVDLNRSAKDTSSLDNSATFKKIPALCISPSQDIGELARAHAHRLPRLIRMTISAMGSLDEASEILSYLLFEPHFCQKLVEMGYYDALNCKEDIENFFKD